jgi:hypothetical protein
VLLRGAAAEAAPFESCAPHLLAAGVSPAEITTQLAHKNARITLAIYSHALPGSAERTSATLAKMILGT